MLTLLEGLKFLRKENKFLSEKLSEKKNSKDLDQQKEYYQNQLERVLDEIEAEKANRNNEVS